MVDSNAVPTAAPQAPQALTQAAEPDIVGAAPQNPSTQSIQPQAPQAPAVLVAPAVNGAEAHTMAANGDSISADEIALYDRQIRLWGVQAQEKIRTANVLLFGLRGLGGETVKNLVLSGIGALTVVDDQLLTEEDLGAQFLVSQGDVGKNRAEAAKTQIQALNPRVKVSTNTSSVLSLLQDVLFFNQFTIVIATDLTVDILQAINSVCRLCAKPFYAAASHGLYGYIFADLIQHTFIIEREKSNMTTNIGPETVTRSIVSTATKKADSGKIIELVTKTEQYSPLTQVLTALLPADRVTTSRRRLQITPILACIKALWQFQINTARPYPNESSSEDIAAFATLATNWHVNYFGLPAETLKSEILRQFLQGVACEINPVCAMVGGALAQNVINVIGQNEQPIQNLMIWDSDELTGEIYAMHPISPAAVSALDPAAAIATGMPMVPMNSDSVNGMVAHGNGTVNGNQ